MSESRNTIITSAVSARTFVKLQQIIEKSESKLSLSGVLNRFALIACATKQQVFEWLMKGDADAIAAILMAGYEANANNVSGNESE